MLLTASLLSLFAKNTFDFWFILVLMFLNFFISFWQESKADNAVKKLQEKLSVQIKTLRDGKWQWLLSKMLVPGDMVELGIGDIIPADAKILQANNLTVNEAALTGESLPKEKNNGDALISGSFITTGNAMAEVTATGKNTDFGKTLQLSFGAKKRSLLEQDILRISKFLTILSLIAVVILTVVLASVHTPWLQIILLDLSLVIAGIPISLPTVMSLIIGFGVLELSKKETIVRRISALENFANVNLLLSDKTGTLTKNKIGIEKIVSYNEKFSESDLVKLATTTASQERNPISQAVTGKFKELGLTSDYKIIKIIPGDSIRKRSTAVIEDANGQKMCVTIGATQVVEKLCDLRDGLAEKFRRDVEKFASQGYRSLAVAVNESGEQEENVQLIGMFLLSDTVFEDAIEAISFLKNNGIAIKMLTGDNMAISLRVAGELQLDGSNEKVVDRQTLSDTNLNIVDKLWWEDKAVFAEILPEDKLKLVQSAEKFFQVAVTGDGVNDLPAIKAADVGIAVSGAVDALKSAADIVLLTSGIAVIKDAVVEARKIFARLYSYSVYRISESLRLIVTIAVLGIIYKMYPLTPVQLILLAFLNDLPIISLAFNRVKTTTSPSEIKVKERFWLSSLFGLTGIVNSLLMFYLALDIFHLSLPVIETLFFLKLTIGGHMLIYIAHTKERWFNFLPSGAVIWATTLTQLLATMIALSGWFMPKAPLVWVIVIWLWAFFWMQISELVKYGQELFLSK
jgi:H+-transporting ATPase